MAGLVKVAAGDLRHRVTLQSPTYTTDDSGAHVPTAWTNAATVWAKVEPLSDSMWAQAAQAYGSMSHRVTIRHYAAIQSDWRVKYGTRYLYLVGPPRNVDEQGVYMELRCDEGEVIA